MRSSCFCCSCLSLPCAFESNPSSLLLRFLAIGWLVLPEWPDWGTYQKQTGSFVLIFACLMPTMTLVRATAMTMPSVRRTQDRLAALPPEHTASGLQLTSQMLGAVMNVGAFALVSAALPKKCRCEQAAGGGTGGHSRDECRLCYGRPFSSALLWRDFICQPVLPAGRSAWALCTRYYFLLLRLRLRSRPGRTFLPLAIAAPAFSNCLAPVVCDLLRDHHVADNRPDRALRDCGDNAAIMYFSDAAAARYLSADYQQFSDVTKK